MNQTTTETTTTLSPTPNSYDDTGAMIYIIIVLLWYSIGIIYMLAMQMRARSELIEESARRRTKLLIRNLRDHSNTKEILEELVDKEKRARLWDIYLGTTIGSKDKLTHAESMRIRHIEKQLANINRNRRLTNETFIQTANNVPYFRSRSDSRQMNPQSEIIAEDNLALRRRSSFDQQTIERWKVLSNQEKPHEQLPWTMRKLLIRRYFRRLPKKSSSNLTPNNPVHASADLSNFTRDITVLTQRHSDENLDEISTTVDERKNPYLTYFYAAPSAARPSILSSELFSSNPATVEK